MRREERGFALIAALIALLAFAAIAFAALARGRGAVVSADAQRTRARLEAAADAGLAMAVAGLTRGRAGGWTIDGVPRRLAFERVDLVVAVEDERGKVPVNIISTREARRMFAAAGAEGDRLTILADSFRDWRDEDSIRRPFGAETADYLARGHRARDGDFRSVEELARLNGMTPAIYARLAPAVTIYFGESGGFSERNAHPLALAVMTGGALSGPALLQRQRELAGQRAALEIAPEDELVGRALTVRVVARDGRGGRLERATVIEATGGADQPVWIRHRG